MKRNHVRGIKNAYIIHQVHKRLIRHLLMDSVCLCDMIDRVKFCAFSLREVHCTVYQNMYVLCVFYNSNQIGTLSVCSARYQAI